MPAWKNTLYFGDNLRIMRDCIPDSCVDSTRPFPGKRPESAVGGTKSSFRSSCLY